MFFYDTLNILKMGGDNLNIENKLKDIIESWDVKPFIFVGAGLSFRYYNLPRWNDLLRDLSKFANPNNPFAYANYLQKAKQEIQDKQIEYFGEEEKFLVSPLIAQHMESDFNKRFLNHDPNCLNSLGYTGESNELIAAGKMTPFKLLIKLYLEDKITLTDIYRHEIDQLKKIENHVRGFITTNYDNFLEHHFAQFQLCIGQEELFNHRFSYSGMIYKLHGCLSDPESIILTSSDYKKVDDKSQYLAAKLLTYFIESPIIFLGYSISDIYIKNIIRNISLCLNEENKRSLSNQLIFIEYVDSPEKETISSIEESGLMITQFCLYDYNKLYNALQGATTALSVGVLRSIESQIVELLKAKDPNKATVYYASDLSNPHLTDDKLGIYIGDKDVVKTYGYKSYEARDIYEDAIFNNKQFDAEQLIQATIPSIKHSISSSKLPLYKYLNNIQNDKKQQVSKYLINNIEDINLPKLSQKLMEYAKTISKIEDIQLLNLTKQEEINLILAKIENFNLEEIVQYLKENFKECINARVISTNFKKIITVLDFLQNKKN